MTGNFSEIASWTLASLAYTLIASSDAHRNLDSPTHFQYLCTNFDALTQRYATTFVSNYGDVLAFSKSAICSVAKGERDPLTPAGYPDPIPKTWFISTFLAGIFTVQASFGGGARRGREASDWAGYLCWYLEDPLLINLYLPGPDVKGSGVDVESSLCARAGGYAKGPSSQYVNETARVSGDVEYEASRRLSKLFGWGMKMLLDTGDKIGFVCEDMKVRAYLYGARLIGLHAAVMWDIVCGKREVDSVEKAEQELLGAMSRLFTWQLLNGGSYEGYHQFLCENLKEESLEVVRLDGKGIKQAACNAAPKI